MQKEDWLVRCCQFPAYVSQKQLKKNTGSQNHGIATKNWETPERASMMRQNWKPNKNYAEFFSIIR